MHIFALGLPHTQTTERFLSCAYTQKVRNLCKMMTERGHHVVHLGTEGSDPVCSENVAVTPKAMHEELYGHPGTGFFHFETDGKFKPYTDLYIANTRKAILERSRGNYKSIICIPWGGPQISAVHDIPQLIVESGIGYQYTFAKYRVFESYAWMHFHHGKENQAGGSKWYDVVIPNYINPDHFASAEQREDYFLFLGRLNADKGVGIAADLAKACKRKLIICGQGDPTPYLSNPYVEYRKPVGVEGRKELLSKAYAFIHPTFYLEPFGGVMVEAMASGCPVITTDWGAMTETVLHGHTGYRCRTWEQFLWAAKHVDAIDRKVCRQWALDNYAMDRMAVAYEDFFQSVLNLDGQGWQTAHPKRPDLAWIQLTYPGLKRPDYSRPHVEPHLGTPWEKAQQFEKDWWHGDQKKWPEEQRKQDIYAWHMGLPANKDLGERKILDLGCGPLPMLLRFRHGPSVGVDPLPMPEGTEERFKAADIRLVNQKAEDYVPDMEFDEVWVYNVLMHVDSPVQVLRTAAKGAKTVRLFEWVGEGGDVGHPHVLRPELFEEFFNPKEWRRVLWDRGRHEGAHGTNTDEYLAVVAERIEPCPPSTALPMSAP